MDHGPDPGVARGTAPAGAPSHAELVRVFLKISVLGFGGPNAHLALMLDEVVERRGWLTREHFLHLIGATNLIPGPNSSEVAIHVGYTQRGWTGALATGLSFLLPTFALVTVAAWLYFGYGAVVSAGTVFWGLKPVVVAIIVAAGLKLGRVAVRAPLSWVLAGAGGLVSVLAGHWALLAMVLGGVLSWIAWRRREPPAGGPPPAAEPPRASRLAMMPLAGLLGGGGAAGTAAVFLTHLWIGAVLFGGGYVLVVLLEPQAVDRFGWLTTAEFLDGVALTQAVPGPISTLSAFVGYAAAGFPGAVAATAGVYLPAFTAVLLLAPHMARLRSLEPVRAVLDGVSAVVAGAILGVAATLLPPAAPDLVAAGLFAAALAAMLWKKVPAYGVILVGLAAGTLRTLLSGGW